MQQRIVAQQFPIALIKSLDELLRLGKKIGPRCNGSPCIEMLDDTSRITRRHTVGGNTVDDHGAGTDDAVLSNRYPFADDGAVTDPDVVFDPNGGGLADGYSIVDIMPVRVGQIGIAGNHTVVAYPYLMRRTYSHPRANQAVIADLDPATARLFGPDGQPDGLIG